MNILIVKESEGLSIFNIYNKHYRSSIKNPKAFILADKLRPGQDI